MFDKTTIIVNKTVPKTNVKENKPFQFVKKETDSLIIILSKNKFETVISTNKLTIEKQCYYSQEELNRFSVSERNRKQCYGYKTYIEKPITIIQYAIYNNEFHLEYKINE